MHLRHLQDDFLVPEEGLSSKIRGYFDNLGAGTNGCAISEVFAQLFQKRA